MRFLGKEGADVSVPDLFREGEKSFGLQGAQCFLTQRPWRGGAAIKPELVLQEAAEDTEDLINCRYRMVADWRSYNPGAVWLRPDCNKAVTVTRPLL